MIDRRVQVVSEKLSCRNSPCSLIFSSSHLEAPTSAGGAADQSLTDGRKAPGTPLENGPTGQQSRQTHPIRSRGSSSSSRSGDGCFARIKFPDANPFTRFSNAGPRILVGLPTPTAGGGLLLCGASARGLSPSPSPSALTGLVSGSFAGVLNSPRQNGAGLLCGSHWLGSLAVLGALVRGTWRCGAGVYRLLYWVPSAL